MYKNYYHSKFGKHGCVNVLASSVKDTDLSNLPEKKREEAKKLRKEDQTIVKARYLNSKGEELNKPYLRWAGENITQWRFLHDHVYEVPRGLVKEVNDETQALPVRSELLDASGTPTTKEGAGIKEHQFVPVGF